MQSMQSMKSCSHAITFAVALLAIGAAGPAPAQVLQVDASLEMNDANGRGRVKEVIGNGPASVTINALNLRTEAVVIDLAFRYRVPPDTIGLDELIDHIEIATETHTGEPFFATSIDTQLIPLNPNRVPLYYRATLYRPTDARSYRVRVKVFGNYE